MQDFIHFSAHYRARLEDLLEQRLIQYPAEENRLAEAIGYSLLNGGKRVRALLIYASALAIGEANDLTDTAAGAVECIHAYSLIHDDLPAMDNDELRRGKPTCHIAFDEATAILAGDALQTMAFELLSQSDNATDAPQRLAMLQILASASGSRGMVAGQAIDLAAVDQHLSLEQLSEMHRLKTGALIKASVQLGALSTNLATEKQLQALGVYAEAIGLAFQVQDDILDVTASTETLGKQQGADSANNKPTFVSLLGLDEAKKKTQQLYDTALNSLGSFDYRADYLRHLAAYIIKRQN